MTTRILAVVFVVAFGLAVAFILAEPSSGRVPVPVVAQPADDGEEGGERDCLNHVWGYPCGAPEPEAGTEPGPRDCLNRVLGYPCPEAP